MQLTIAQLKRKAEWALRKAEENAASSAPWAPANVRLCQNCYNKWYGDYLAACKREGIES